MSISTTSSLVTQAKKDGAREAARQAKKYHAALTLLVSQVSAYLAQFDAVLAQHPDTSERGEKLARLQNDLEMVNDRVRYFTLGRTGKKRAGWKP